MKRLKALSESHRTTVLRVIGEYILLNGRHNPESLAAFIPLWKKHGLYDECVSINKGILDIEGFRKGQGKMIREAIAGLELPEFIPCSRDFLKGMFMASGERVRGAPNVFPVYEFIGAKQYAHVISFLASCKVNFMSFKPPRDKYLVRTSTIYFMLVEPKGDKEQQITGMIAGGAPKYVDGSLYISLKPACAKLLDTMGMHYCVRKSGGGGTRLHLSAFYLPLYISGMPPALFDFWMGHMPVAPCGETHAASLVAMMHWVLMFDRRARVGGALPYLLSTQGAVGKFTVRDARAAAAERKIDMVDSRLVARMHGWMTTYMGEEAFREFMSKKKERESE